MTDHVSKNGLNVRHVRQNEVEDIFFVWHTSDADFESVYTRRIKNTSTPEDVLNDFI